MGYGLPAGGTQAGKFEYTREGVNPAKRDTYPTGSLRSDDPMNMAGCAITSLNSPSNLEISWSSSPHHASLPKSLTQDEGARYYGDCTLAAFALGVPPAIRFVASSRFEHAETDACDVAGNSVAGIVFGYCLSQEMIVILSERVVSLEGSERSSLVDRLQHSAVPGFAPAVTASATELLMFNQPAVTEVLSAMGETPCIDHTGHDLHRSNGADAVNVSLETDQLVAPGKGVKASLVLRFAAPVEINVLLEDPANEGSALPFVPMTQCERFLLVQDPNTTANNIFVGTRQKSQLIHCMGIPFFVATFIFMGQRIAERSVRTGIVVTVLGVLGVSPLAAESGFRLFATAFTEAGIDSNIMSKAFESESGWYLGFLVLNLGQFLAWIIAGIVVLHTGIAPKWAGVALILGVPSLIIAQALYFKLEIFWPLANGLWLLGIWGLVAFRVRSVSSTIA